MWFYGDQMRDKSRLRSVALVENCIFCGDVMELEEAGEWPPHWNNIHRHVEAKTVTICLFCGWWRHQTMASRAEGGLALKIHACAAGILKDLDAGEVTEPLAEVRSFLNGRYGERFSMDPARFETTVAAVFNGLGYKARVTGQSRDGGIDVMLDGPRESVIGVQVKRYKNKIEAHQIRELTGALVHNRLTKGVFVTTSDFTAGADKSATKSQICGFPIELINASKFFDAMKIAANFTRARPRATVTKIRTERRRAPELAALSRETATIRALRGQSGIGRVLSRAEMHARGLLADFGIFGKY